MKMHCKKTDERELNEMRRLGNNSFWAMTLALTAAILIQAVFTNPPIYQILGELAALIFGIGFFCVSYMINGLWDTHTKPTLKTYVISSIVAGLIAGTLNAIKVYFAVGGLAARIALSMGITFVITFVLTFLILSSIGTITKKRASLLEEKYKD